VTFEELQRAWVQQAQADAERGVIVCRICRAYTGLDKAVTLWRDGVLAFAVCDPCAYAHELLMQPRPEGIEIRARLRAPLAVRGPG
jgi:hypothetical protein